MDPFLSNLILYSFGGGIVALFGFVIWYFKRLLHLVETRPAEAEANAIKHTDEKIKETESLIKRVEHEMHSEIGKQNNTLSQHHTEIQKNLVDLTTSINQIRVMMAEPYVNRDTHNELKTWINDRFDKLENLMMRHRATYHKDE